jgi:hypothetical protein
MSRTWLKNWFTKGARRPAARFSPRVTELEARDVPATFYVDPNAPSHPAGGTNVFFNFGQPGQIAVPLADVVPDIVSAITAANANPGTDTIQLAAQSDPFFVNEPANTPAVISGSVNIIGSGTGASLVQTSNGVDQIGAVLEANGAVTVNFSNLTFFGGSSGFVGGAGTVAAGDTRTGVFVRYQGGATGTINNVAFGGIFNDNPTPFGGFGALATGAGTTLTIQNSTFGNIGRVGASADAGATLNLFGDTYTGKGAGSYTDVFGQYTNGATGAVSGNRVTGNSGIAPDGSTSAALTVSQGGGAAASVQAYGNTFSGNLNGVVVGDNAADTSTATLSYNNILGNFTGVGANPPTGTAIDASHVWWGAASGPFNATTNPSGAGNPVADRVTFAPLATSANPVLSAPTLPAYLAAAFPPPVVSPAVIANAAEPSTQGTIRFTRTGGDQTVPVTINYTVSGSAVSGVDFQPLPGSVTIPANQAFADVHIIPIDNTVVNPTRTVTLTVAAGTGYTGVGNAATAFIVDNDAAASTASVSVTGTANATQGSPGSFTVTRTGGDQTQPLTVTYTVAGTAVPGTNYTALSGSVTIPANQTSATIPVTALTTGPSGTTTVVLTLSAGPNYTASPNAATVTVTGPTSPPPPPAVGLSKEFAAGPDNGGAPVASLYNPDGTLRFTQTVFAGNATGGVRVAAADVNGDGVADLIVGTGPGVPTQVRVIDGVTQATITVITPFEPAFLGGVFVAAGDLNGDGKADIVVTPDEGGGPRVIVFDGTTFAPIANFFGIDDPNFRGGARAAVGDINGDGHPDLVVAAGFGGGPRVAFFDGTTITNPAGPTKLINDIFVFEQTLRNGVFVAAGDMNGDGKADLIVGGGPGGGPRVLALSGAGLMAGQADQSPALANFFAGDPNNRGGVHVAAKNLDGDNLADLVVGGGPSGGDEVFSYLGSTFVNGVAPTHFAFPAFGGFPGGVFVG